MLGSAVSATRARVYFLSIDMPYVLSIDMPYGRGMNRGRERDDWFEGTEPKGRSAPARAGDEDAGEDWLLDDDLPPPRPWCRKP
jgi:hypothetical protein